MKYAVIDTNVLVSSQMTHHEDSATRRTLRLILNGDVTPVITPAILAEYQEVLSRPKLHIRQETAEMVITYFIKYGKTVTPVAYAKPLPDEKDRAFLEAALALFDEDAVLVTGNAKHFPPAPFIVTPAEFIARIADI